MFFSLIIATYNSSKSITKCINSILNQEFDNFEVIIKDNNSEDQTVRIIKNLFQKKKFNKFNLIVSADNSVYEAWNIALKKSKGSYIMFLGSDDFLNKNALKEYYGYIRKNKYPIYVYCRAQKINSKNILLNTIGDQFNINLFKTHMCIVHTGSIQHKKIFDLYGYFNTNYKIAGDYEFLLRFYKYENIHFLNKILLKSSVGGLSEFSIKAQIEAMNAKMNHKTKKILFIYIDTFFIILKTLIKKFFRYTNVNF